MNFTNDDLKRLLIEGLELMKKINGSDDNCVMRSGSDCPNHRWIHAVEAWRESKGE